MQGWSGSMTEAQKYLPEIGTETPGNSREWLGEITLRHLATMTAGLDDGRPPRLVYRPGTGGIYSNDTANMLAELLTLQFDEDLLVGIETKGAGPDRRRPGGLALAGEQLSGQDLPRADEP